MSNRIEVELTSQREDGTWTWRAAGARQPKGVVDGSLLPDGAKVGDVLKADAESGIDGITLTAFVTKGERHRSEPERIEILGSRRAEPGVTTQLVEKRGRGGRGDRDRDGRGRGERGERGQRGDRRGGPPDRDRGRGRPERGRDERRERPEPEPRPRAKRLKAGRTHRQAVLQAVAVDQRPIAEIVLRGGIPGVRQAIDRMNDAAKAHGQPAVAAEPLLGLAEKLLPHLRMAEWHDRADAALADVDELDLRDLRQVVVAADANARDEATRELAEQLRTALTRRVDEEHAAWLAELSELLDEGRVVRALRLSSRPPKAGARFPAELAARLVEAASASLTSDISSDRYATVLDALAYAPVRAQVVPEGIPARPSDALVAAVTKIADRVPKVAEAFGIEATAAAPASRRPRPAKKAGARPVPPPPAGVAAPTASEAATDGPTPDTPGQPADAVAPAGGSSDESPVADASESAPPAPDADAPAPGPDGT